MKENTQCMVLNRPHAEVRRLSLQTHAASLSSLLRRSTRLVVDSSLLLPKPVQMAFWCCLLYLIPLAETIQANQVSTPALCLYLHPSGLATCRAKYGSILVLSMQKDIDAGAALWEGER